MVLWVSKGRNIHHNICESMYSLDVEGKGTREIEMMAWTVDSNNRDINKREWWTADGR